jgi:ribosomal protein L24
MKALDATAPWNTLRSGTPVVIAAGPLQGVRGTVLGVDDKQSLIVVVTLWRGWTAVALDPQWVHVEDSETPVCAPVTH